MEHNHPKDEALLISLILRDKSLFSGLTLFPSDLTSPLAKKVLAHKLRDSWVDYTNVVTCNVYSADEEKVVLEWMEIQTRIASADDVARLCQKIKQASHKHYALRCIQDMHVSIRQGADIDSVVAIFNRVISREEAAGYKTVGEAMGELKDSIAICQEHGTSHLFVPTGIKEYDHHYGGLEKGKLHILAGRPAMGKSALSLQLATSISMNHVTAVHSLEMASSSLCTRLLSRHMNINSRRIKHGKINMDEKLDRSLAELSSLNMFIDDTSRQSLEYISTAAHRLQQRNGLGALIVDYLGIMDQGQGREPSHEKIGAITKGLRKLAKDLNVPVLLLSQLNRDLEKRADKRPLTSDLKGSGDVEQDADVIMLLYRDSVYNDLADPMATDLIIAKNRDDETMTINLRWNRETTSFTSDFVDGFPDHY